MLYVKIHEKAQTGKPKAMMLFPRDFEKMEYIMGFAIPIAEYLSTKYDLVIITGSNSDITHYKKYAEVWGFSAIHLGKLKDSKFKRAVEMQEGEDSNWEYNQAIVTDELKSSFGEEYFANLEKIFIIDPIDFILPQTSYVPKKESEILCELKNEYHDSVIDENTNLIHEYDAKIAGKYYSRCSVLAFGSHNKNISMALIEFAVKTSNSFQMVYAYINDPAFYTPIFTQWNIPFTSFYFANDNRGTRDFKEFPIGELQHLIWDERKKKKDLLALPTPIVKDKDFFFAGTIFQEKGGRVELYERYLKKLRLENSSLYIPQRSNGIVYSKNNNDRYINKLTDKFSELHTNVLEHPMYAGHLIPSEYEEEVKRYRYGMLFRCVSYYDSLNFRPILYARLRILPLIDPQYDPQCLQIPSDIQRRLVVNSEKDIEDKVKYFNEHPEEREKLLDQLEYKFKVKSFDREWKQILSTYI